MRTISKFECLAVSGGIIGGAPGDNRCPLEAGPSGGSNEMYGDYRSSGGQCSATAANEPGFSLGGVFNPMISDCSNGGQIGAIGGAVFGMVAPVVGTTLGGVVGGLGGCTVGMGLGILFRAGL